MTSDDVTFHFREIQDAAAAILKIHLNGHNSVAIAHIHTKFGSETKTDVPDTEIPPNFTAAKIQHGGRLPF